MTTAALSQHDAVNTSMDYDCSSQTNSEGARTFKSWSSHWTDCTSNTFGCVSSLWNSNSELHREVTTDDFVNKIFQNKVYQILFSP